MATSDAQALLLQVSADVRGLEKALNRAAGIVDESSSRMERRTGLAVRSMERSLGNIRLPKQLRQEYQRLGEDIGRGLGDASRAAQIALLGISAVAIKLAADAAEIESAFDVAFKESAKSAREFSDVLANRVGRDAIETRQAMTRLQLVLTGTGVAAEQAAEMVKRLAEAGIDAGSLFNTSDAEAFQKIISGISGESEPLKAFGVVINEAALKAELLRLGFKGTASEASESAKSVARINLIIKGLVVAQGDAERTAGSAANQTRRLRAEFNNAARDLGNELLPAFVKLTKGTTDVLRAFNDLPGGVQVAGLAILAFIAAGGPIAGLLANLKRVIDLAKETRKAIAGIAAANVAAGATGAAAGGGAVAGRIGLAATAGAAAGAGAAVGSVAVAGAEIVRGARYNRTVKAAQDATDAALAGAINSATAQIKALDGAGPAARNRIAKLQNDIAILTAEQVRRAAGATGAAGGGTTAPATVQGGFTLSPEQLTPVGGGKTKKGKAAPRDLSDEQSAQIAAQIAAAERDVLQARLDLAINADERAAIERQIIGQTRAQEDARLSAQIAAIQDSKGLSKAKKDSLIAELEALRLKNQEVADLQEQAVERERVQRNLQEQADITRSALLAEEQLLAVQSGLAKTAAERRDIELRRLQVAEDVEREEIRLLRATGDAADAAEAAARERVLNEGAGARRRDVLDQTAGPLESYFNELPRTVTQVNERMEHLAANGIRSVVDGLADAVTGARSLGDVFKSVVAQMLADITRLNIERALGSMFSGSGGGFGGSGGGFNFLSLFKAGSGDPLAGLYAEGTDSAKGGLSLVGERGPELLNIPRGSQVIPNDILRGLTKMGGNASNTWAPNVSLSLSFAGGANAADQRRTASQVEAATMRALARARKQGF